MNIKRGLTFGVALSVVAFMGCSGDTDGGKAGTPDGDVFVATGETVGTIVFEVNDDDMPIGEKSGFHVYAKNSDGQPVQHMTIACDSEKGLAILEPTTGKEITDEVGQISGVVGCERRGSLQLVCRATTGGNLRAFHTYKCRGEVPSGFQGFPGAGGGGLGGGVAVTNDGQVRITAIGLNDQGSSKDVTTNSAVDVFQSGCPVAMPTTPEPFFDTYVAIKIENNLREQVHFNYIYYSVADVNRSGLTFTSQHLGVTGDASSSLDANGDVQTLVVPVFKASGGKKYFGNSPGNGNTGLEISSTLGLKTITFTAVGETSSGKTISVSSSVTASFGNFNECTS